MTTTVSRRQLPAVKAALKKAEDSRYYKSRANKYITELELERVRKDLDKRQVFCLAQNNFQQLELRMEIIHRVDEEKELLLEDVKCLERVEERIERIRRAQQQEKLKYKRADTVKPLRERPKMKKPPAREPQIKVNLALVYPDLKKKNHFKRMYANQFLRPVASRQGEKCVDWIREKYTPRDEEAEIMAEFLPYFSTTNRTAAEEEEEREENFKDDEPPSQELLEEGINIEEAAVEQEDKTEKEADQDSSAELAFVTRQGSKTRFQMGGNETNENVHRMLQQVQEMRHTIQLWGLPPSKTTQDRLRQCVVVRKKIVKKARPRQCTQFHKRESELETESDDDDSEDDENNDDDDPLTFKDVKLPKSKTRSYRNKLPAIEEASLGSSRKSSGKSVEMRKRSTTKLPPIQKGGKDEEEELIEKLRELKRQVRTKRADGSELSPILSVEASRENTMMSNESNLSEQEIATKRHSVRKAVTQLSQLAKKQRKNSRVTKELVTEEEVMTMTPEQLAAFQDAWKQVLKCRYIRGHEPAVMRLPEVPITEFVFSEKHEEDNVALSEANNYTLTNPHLHVDGKDVKNET